MSRQRPEGPRSTTEYERECVGSPKGATPQIFRGIPSDSQGNPGNWVEGAPRSLRQSLRQNAFGLLQDATVGSQDSPSCSQDSRSWLQSGPRWLQDGKECLQDAHLELQIFKAVFSGLLKHLWIASRWHSRVHFHPTQGPMEGHVRPLAGLQVPLEGPYDPWKALYGLWKTL
jgi:hypothetical protein